MASSSEFIGSWVELNCGDLGKYTGEIVSVSHDKITITKAQQDGKPCSSLFVTFNGEFLRDMKLLDNPVLPCAVSSSKEQVAPNPTRCNSKVASSPKAVVPGKVQVSNASNQSNNKQIPNLVDMNSGVESSSHTNSHVKPGNERRDKLRNIPNTVTAYICPVSPPALRKITRRTDCEDTINSSQKRGVTPDNAWPKGVTQSGCAFQPYRRRSHSGDDTQLTTVMGSQDPPSQPQSRNSNRFSAKKRQQTNTNSGGRQRQQSWLFSDVDEVKREEFDFEGNLALFDKAAFYQETSNNCPTSSIDRGDFDQQGRFGSGSKPDLVVEATKYKCSEYVLADANTCPPVDSRDLITLPTAGHSDSSKACWVTDQGRRIPVLPDGQLRNRVFATADKLGLTWSKISELSGRTVAELVIQQLGGESRLSVANLHQTPHVVVLLGRHKTGALGAAIARHLVSREIKVTICLPEWAIVDPFCALFATEFQLFKDIGSHEDVLRNPKDLPKTPVDFIVSCIEELDSPSNSELGRDARLMFAWCEDNRAPLMTINPPPVSSVRWKLCVQLALPAAAHNKLMIRGNDGNFWPSVGHVYLLDVGFTKAIYSQLDINYLSPFGGKSILAIHPPKPKRT